MEYPEYIMQYLRQREGLAESDTSMDAKLRELSPREAFAEVCEWNGFIHYDRRILGWVDACFGTSLTDD